MQIKNCRLPNWPNQPKYQIQFCEKESTESLYFKDVGYSYRCGLENPRGPMYWSQFKICVSDFANLVKRQRILVNQNWTSTTFDIAFNHLTAKSQLVKSIIILLLLVKKPRTIFIKTVITSQNCKNRS